MVPDTSRKKVAFIRAGGRLFSSNLKEQVLQKSRLSLSKNDTHDHHYRGEKRDYPVKSRQLAAKRETFMIIPARKGMRLPFGQKSSRSSGEKSTRFQGKGDFLSVYKLPLPSKSLPHYEKRRLLHKAREGYISS